MGMFKLLNKLMMLLVKSKPGRSTETQAQAAHSTGLYTKVEFPLFNTKFKSDQAYPILDHVFHCKVIPIFSLMIFMFSWQPAILAAVRVEVSLTQQVGDIHKLHTGKRGIIRSKILSASKK